MRTVTLKSLARTIQTLNLNTDYDPHHLTVQRVEKDGSGQSATRDVRVVAPGVLTLLAGAHIKDVEEAIRQGAAKDNLPESVLNAPEVKAALEAKPPLLQVIREKAPTAKPAPAAPADTAETRQGRQRVQKS